MKVSDYVIDTLASEGVTHVFELCGGALAHLLDSLYMRTDIRAVSVHHEMAAAIAAEGYARAGGNIGVAMATSGPGATNLITGIGSCYFDSIPCLFITGQVNTYEYKYDRPVRQIGFQETDIVSIVKPVTKFAAFVPDPAAIPEMLSRGISTARDGRPGPVLLDIPLDVQRGDTGTDRPYRDNRDRAGLPAPRVGLDTEISDLIGSRSRPVILAGGGVRSAKATAELASFARATGIPVAVTLMGIDSFPHDDPLYVGMIGTYGNRYANLTVANADLLIALGTRFDTRQTGTLPGTFARGATKIHVDIDSSELNNKIAVDLPLNMDVRDFLAVVQGENCRPCCDLGAWHRWIAELKGRYPAESTGGDLIDPNTFFPALSEVLPDNAIVCTDVGQVQMWAAQALIIREGQRFLTQGGMASIGSALPMAIGASFARPGSPVVVLTGDGGFQLNIQELQTVYHHNLPITIILLNNAGYGMIRQFQEQYFGSRFQSSVIGYSNPDFQEIAGAYRIRHWKIAGAAEVGPALGGLFRDGQPFLLEVVIDERFRVLPKLAVNKPIEDQEPPLPRDELRSLMIVDPLDEEERK